MSRTYYDSIAVDGLKEILVEVSTICKKLGIEFFIAGAVARNIWLASHNKQASGTKDVDFGVFVSTEEQYNQLRTGLREKYNYQISKTNAFCLITPAGRQVDLLPFGAIENEGRVMIEGKGLTSINLDGFKESFEFGANMIMIGNSSYMICSIPAMVVLKLIAFDDRPHQRIQDVKDVNAICQHYPDLEDESIWSNHSDLYEEDREHRQVAMIALGREIKNVVNLNPHLKRRVMDILDLAIREESDFLRHMIEDTETETIEMKAKQLQLIKLGIVHKSPA